MTITRFFRDIYGELANIHHNVLFSVADFPMRQQA